MTHSCGPTPQPSFLFILAFTLCLALTFLAASVAISVHEDIFVQPSIGFPVPFWAALIGTFVVCIVRNRTSAFPRMPTMFLLIVILLSEMAIISSVWYVQRAPSALSWLAIQFLALIFAFYAVYTLRRAGINPVEYVMRFVTAFGMAAFAFAIVLYICGDIPVGFARIEQFPNYPRLYGWFGNPNLFASTMGVATLASYAYLMDGSKISPLRAATAAALFFGVILSGSKAVLAGVVITLVLAHGIELLPSSRRSLSIARKPWLIAALALLGVLTIAATRIVHVDAVVEGLRFQNADVTSGRAALWTKALSLLEEADSLRFMLGHGYEYFLDNFSRSAHSFYVRAAIEHGAVFLALFTVANMTVVLLAAGNMRGSVRGDATLSRFVFLVILFMLIRNVGTPSFLQVRIENLVYLFALALFFSSRVSGGGSAIRSSIGAPAR